MSCSKEYSNRVPVTLFSNAFSILKINHAMKEVNSIKEAVSNSLQMHNNRGLYSKTSLMHLWLRTTILSTGMLF